MKHYRPLVLIALALLLVCSAAGAWRASAMPAQPELQTLPAWEHYGFFQGERPGIAGWSAGQASGDAFLPDLAIMPSWEYYPGDEEQGVRLGWAVAGAGLVNGDLYADILVGADKGGANREGWAGLFLGSNAGPQTMTAWEVLGENKGDLFGGALDSAGDVDGDGYADIAVGASNHESSLAGEGAVYVYMGGATGLPLTPDWKAVGGLQSGRFGMAVAGAGDVNGDGYSDLVVGMPGFAYEDKTNAGKALVYFGSPDGLTMVNVWYDIGTQSAAQFGTDVNAAGDVNGDGYDDVLIGEPYYDAVVNDVLYLDAGAVYLYLGNGGEYGLSNIHVWSYYGYRGADHLGITVAPAGDLNGDGCDDVAIGAPGYNIGSLLDTGRVYVFYGCRPTLSGLNDVPDWWFSIEQANANVGIDVSSAGDTNNDGYDDLLVGAHLYDDEQANEGTVYAFFGGPDGLGPLPGWQADGNKNDTYFGYAVDGAGDTNGDGFNDALVGAPTFRVNEVIKGAAFLFFGTQQATVYHSFMPFVRK
jgi:hypothetical protein